LYAYNRKGQGAGPTQAMGDFCLTETKPTNIIVNNTDSYYSINHGLLNVTEEEKIYAYRLYTNQAY
jgi:hypothetical protein